MLIDCSECSLRDSSVCADCVVTFICDREPDDAVIVDLAERRALAELARVGLAPDLRHAGPCPRATPTVAEQAPSQVV